MTYKNCRITIAMLLTLSLSLCVPASASNENISNGEKVRLAVEETKTPSEPINTGKQENERKASLQYQNLLNEFKEDKESYNGEEYPDYFAGAYINDEGNLVVRVTDYSVQINEQVKNITGNSDIIIVEANYSYNELKDTQNQIAMEYEKLYDYYVDQSSATDEANLLDSISGYYIDDKSNKLIIQIKDLTDEKIATYKELFPYDSFVEFGQGYTATLTSDWQPGRRIWTSESAGLSTGWRAYYTNSAGTRINGFITCAHGFDVGDYVYRAIYSSYLLGQCMLSHFGDTVDAAFIQITDSDYTPSNIVYYADSSGTLGGVSLSTAMTLDIASGATIYKAGATSYLTSGTVLSNSYYGTFGGETFTDLNWTTALNLGGDSGAAVYVNFLGISYPVGGTMFASQHTGDELTAETFTYSFFCDIYNIQDELGCTLY